MKKRPIVFTAQVIQKFLALRDTLMVPVPVCFRETQYRDLTQVIFYQFGLRVLFGLSEKLRLMIKDP